jgi:hypothetical protein
MNEIRLRRKVEALRSLASDEGATQSERETAARMVGQGGMMGVKPLDIDWHAKPKPVYADAAHPNGFPCPKCGALMRKLHGRTFSERGGRLFDSTWTCDFCNAPAGASRSDAPG